MGLIEFLVLLLIAGICGALGQALAGGPSRGGCFVSIALGFVGALLGSWLARTLNLPDLFSLSIGGVSFPIVWSIIGGALFAGALGLIQRGGR